MIKIMENTILNGKRYIELLGWEGYNSSCIEKEDENRSLEKKPAIQGTFSASPLKNGSLIA
jgi:hypothetical protein